MKNFTEGQHTDITFLNEPKMSEHEVDKTRNERRGESVTLLKDFLACHERFMQKKVNVTFSHHGVSSLVAILETPEEKLVMKISLRNDQPEGENEFLKVWESAGVKTPHIFEEGSLGGRLYSIMEYIDAETLATAPKDNVDLEKRTFDLGKTLHMMHVPKTEGFGRIFGGKPEHADFASWLAKFGIQRDRVGENGLITAQEHGSLDEARSILLTYGETEVKSSYCHYDYGSNNTFNTEPITVFDPDPILSLPIIDLGRSIVLAVSGSGKTETAKHFIAGYESSGEKVDRRVLQASILLNSAQKFSRWSKTKKNRLIANVQKYLTETKHFLASEAQH